MGYSSHIYIMWECEDSRILDPSEVSVGGPFQGTRVRRGVRAATSLISRRSLTILAALMVSSSPCVAFSSERLLCGSAYRGPGIPLDYCVHYKGRGPL